jgi:hypothetical protein
MNVASWYAFYKTTKKQLIHGVFTEQLLMVFIIINKFFLQNYSTTHAFFSY